MPKNTPSAISSFLPMPRPLLTPQLLFPDCLFPRTAADVFHAVDSLLQTYPSTMVTVIGHSLGAALALLDGVRLRMLLAPTTDVKVIGYGMPRVGNHVFASFVDNLLPGSVKHINNKHDPVPIVPAMRLGYHHVVGEIHIQQNGEWISCPAKTTRTIAASLVLSPPSSMLNFRTILAFTTMSGSYATVKKLLGFPFLIQVCNGPGDDHSSHWAHHSIVEQL